MTSLIRLMLMVSLLTASAQEAEQRIWTSTKGNGVKASFVGVKAGKVQLRSPDGKIGAIPLTSLIPADRKAARKLAGLPPEKKAKGAKAGENLITKAKKGQLPTFANGEWKQCHTVYQAPTFVAKLSASGSLYLQPLSGGEPVGKAMEMKVQRLRLDPKAKAGRLSYLKHTDFTEAPEPTILTVKEHTLSIKGSFQDGCAYKLAINLEPDEVTFQLEHDLASVSDANSMTRLILRLPQTLDAQSMETAQIKAATAGWSLSLRGKNIQKSKLTFWNALKSQTGVETATIVGPWGNRSLTTKITPYKRDGRSIYGSFSIYAQRALHDGAKFVLDIRKKGEEAERKFSVK